MFSLGCCLICVGIGLCDFFNVVLDWIWCLMMKMIGYRNDCLGLNLGNYFEKWCCFVYEGYKDYVLVWF